MILNPTRNQKLFYQNCQEQRTNESFGRKMYTQGNLLIICLTFVKDRKIQWISMSHMIPLDKYIRKLLFMP